MNSPAAEAAAQHVGAPRYKYFLVLTEAARSGRVCGQENLCGKGRAHGRTGRTACGWRGRGSRSALRARDKTNRLKPSTVSRANVATIAATEASASGISDTRGRASRGGTVSGPLENTTGREKSLPVAGETAAAAGGAERPSVARQRCDPGCNGGDHGQNRTRGRRSQQYSVDSRMFPASEPRGRCLIRSPSR